GGRDHHIWQTCRATNGLGWWLKNISHRISSASSLPAPPPASMIFTRAIASGSDRALGSCGRKPGANKFDHLLDGEPLRDHERLDAAVAAGGGPLPAAPTIRLGGGVAWSSGGAWSVP